MAAGVERTMVRAEHRDGTVEFPLAVIEGARPGPTLAVISGMHGGEYSGVLAAIQLIQGVDPSTLAGRLLVVPVISTRAFMLRTMQLSPVDQKEAHFVWPGNPSGSYSELLIDLLFDAIKDADYVVDLHAGEFAQGLEPYACLSWSADERLNHACAMLGRAWDVPSLDRRVIDETPLALPKVLLDRGIPNLWTEIGRNGLPDPRTIALQYDGLVNLLRILEMAPGEPRRFTPRFTGPRHWSVYAERSGIWRAAVEPGERVRAGQRLGELHDYFGEQLEVFHATEDALVQYIATSPAINVERQPHGYRWHQLLVQLTEDPEPPA
jgi:predicted deacylase